MPGKGTKEAANMTIQTISLNIFWNTQKNPEVLKKFAVTRSFIEKSPVKTGQKNPVSIK